MKTEILVALIAFSGVIITIIGTLAGTILGTHLSKKSSVSAAKELAELERIKYTHDRLWDARKDTYAAMLASIASVRRSAQSLYNGYFDDEDGLPPEAFCGTPHWGKINTQLWNGWRECQAEFDRGRLIFSDDFIARFETLAGAVYGEEDDNPPDRASDTVDALNLASDDLLKIARAEIAPSEPSAKATRSA